VFDQRVGGLRDQGEEVLAGDLQAMVDEAVEHAVITEGEIALEDDPVKAAQGGEDEGSELGGEGVVRIHGVLPQGVTSEATRLAAQRLPFQTLLVAAPTS